MSNLKKYEEWTGEDADAEKEQLDKLDPASAFYKWENGKNTFRFLPPRIGARSPVPGVFEHYVTVPGKDRGVKIVCPAIHAEPKRACIVCKRAQQLSESRSARDQDAAKSMTAKRRHYANVIDRKNEEKGPQILGFPKTVYDALVTIRSDDAAGGNYTDPGPKGFDIVVVRTGQGKMDTKYDVKAARESTPLCEDATQADEWLESMHNLAKQSTVLSNKEIMEKLGWDDGDDVEEAAPAPRGRAASRRAVDDADSTD